MADRRGQIVRLLETRDQHLPQPSWSGVTAARHGFVHQTLAPAVCPVCEGVDSWGCTGCGGRGEVEVRRSRDPYAESKTQPYGFNGTPHDRGYAIDAELARLEAQLAPPASEADLLANVRPEGWEVDRRRAYAQYDYAALDRALELLRSEAEAAYHVLHAVYVYGWQTAPGPATLAVAEVGLSFLSERLPDPLRAPDAEGPPRVVAPIVRGAGRVLFAERDARIRRRILVDGEPTVSVAVSEGLSVSQVNRVIAKGAAA